MPRKSKPEPEPVPSIPFTPPELDTLSAVADAIGKVKRSIEFRLERNKRERSLLDRAQIQAQLLLLLLGQVNAVATER